MSVPMNSASKKRFHTIMKRLNPRHDPSNRVAMVNEAVALIEKFPTLALAEYDYRDISPQPLDVPRCFKYYYCSVLYILAFCGATKEQIEFVYTRCPRKDIRPAQFIRILEGYSTSDVARFLLKIDGTLKDKADEKNYHPRCASLSNQYEWTRMFPIHIVLMRHMGQGKIQQTQDEREAWLRLARTMIKGCPFCGENMLRWALTVRCPDPVIELILDNLTKPIKKFDVNRHQPLVVSLRGSKHLSRIIPTLERFESLQRNGFGSADAFICLMESMANHGQNLKRLTLQLPSSWLQPDSPALHSFQAAIATCPSLEKLSFLFGNQEERDHSTLIEAICHTMAQRLTPINFLKLEGATIHQETTLPLLLASGAGATTLRLDRITVLATSLELPTISCNSCLEKLYMRDFSSRKPALVKSIISFMSSSKTLNNFLMSPFQRIPALDVTDQVVELVRNAGQLQGLELRFQVDLVALLEAMMDHTSLLEADVHARRSDDLKQNNARKQISYITQLNDYGRKEAGDPRTTKTSLVRLIEKVSRTAVTAQRTSFHYGLLHENPGVWTTK